MIQLLSVSVALFAIAAEPEPVGTVLTLQLDEARVKDAKIVDMKQLAEIIGRIVNPPGTKQGTVELNDDKRQIKVSIFGRDTKVATDLNRYLSISGTIEFRILANTVDHRIIIERATGAKNRKETEVHNDDGKVVARWVTLDTDTFPPDSRRNLITRDTGSDGVEVLVAIDRFNVGGADLVSVICGKGPIWPPCLSFRLAPEAGKRFEDFTSINRPDRVTAFSRRLGIVINNRVRPAPHFEARSVLGGRSAGLHARGSRHSSARSSERVPHYPSTRCERRASQAGQIAPTSGEHPVQRRQRHGPLRPRACKSVPPVEEHGGDFFFSPALQPGRVVRHARHASTPRPPSPRRSGLARRLRPQPARWGPLPASRATGPARAATHPGTAAARG